MATGSDKRPKAPDMRTTLRAPELLHVRPAARNAQSARRERTLREVTERRHAAVRGTASHDAAAPFPSVSEMREAILIDRE